MQLSTEQQAIAEVNPDYAIAAAAYNGAKAAYENANTAVARFHAWFKYANAEKTLQDITTAQLRAENKRERL